MLMLRHLSKKQLLTCCCFFIVALAFGVVALSEFVLPRVFIVPRRTSYDQSAPADSPAKYGLAFTAFDAKTSDGLTLKGWFVPAVDRPARASIIVLHGWCGSKEWTREIIRLVVTHGYNAIAFDSRAHGASGGQYCTYGVREKDDVSAVLEEAQKRFGNIGPVGVLGISFGGAVAIQALAADKRLRFGIAISSFCRLEDVARVQMRLFTKCDHDWLFHRVLAKGEAWGGFKAADVQPTEAARGITQPILVIHGEHDNLCPIGDARQLFEHLASTNKEWFPAANSDHDHILGSSDLPEINRRIVMFLARFPLMSTTPLSHE